MCPQMQSLPYLSVLRKQNGKCLYINLTLLYVKSSCYKYLNHSMNHFFLLKEIKQDETDCKKMYLPILRM